jgi:hypothetical protein
MDMCKGNIIIKGFKYSLYGFQLVDPNRRSRITNNRGLFGLKSSLNQTVKGRK